MGQGYLDSRAGMEYAVAPGFASGDEFFVSSVLGLAGNDGRGWGAPKATIAQALALCSAGDSIYVAEDHAEAIIAAGTLDLSVAGVSIIGLGRGSRKPTLTWGTATTATLLVSAANVLIRNIRCVCNIDNLVKMIDVNADSCFVEDCTFVTSSTKEALSFVNIRTTKDYLTLRRNRFEQPTDPAGTNGGADTGAIYCVDTEHITVENCIFDGFFETAILHNKTTACKYLKWHGNRVNQQLTDAARILLVVGTVGMSIQPDADFVPGRGYPVKRATAALPATTTTAYFTVSGGWIALNNLMGEVTTVLQTQACNLNFQANPSAAGTSLDICAVLNVSAAAAASVFSITGTLANALLNGVAAVAQSTSVMCPPGSIDAVASATNTGSVKWHLWWIPVDTSLGVPNVYAA